MVDAATAHLIEDFDEAIEALQVHKYSIRNGPFIR